MKYMEVEKEDGLVIVTLDGMKDLNLFNRDILNEFYDVLSGLEKEDTGVIIITGKGEKAFSAGSDLNVEMELNESTGKKWSELGQKIVRKIENLPVPVIGAVKGYALGGGMEIITACDILISSKDAKFGIPEVAYGVIPGWGGTQRLVRLVGRGKAMEMILSGDTIDAEEAHRIGLVNKVVEDPLEEAKRLGKKITENAPISLKFSKKLINEAFYNEVDYDAEAKLFAECFTTEDQKEGMNSFFEKRKPKFKGK